MIAAAAAASPAGQSDSCHLACTAAGDWFIDSCNMRQEGQSAHR